MERSEIRDRWTRITLRSAEPGCTRVRPVIKKWPKSETSDFGMRATVCALRNTPSPRPLPARAVRGTSKTGEIHAKDPIRRMRNQRRGGRPGARAGADAVQLARHRSPHVG